MDNYLAKQQPMFAFNVWDINSAKAVIDGALCMNKNVILQTSSGVFAQMEKKQFREFIDSYTNDKGIKIWIHLDHCKDISLIKQAIEYKWDSVMIDASDKDIDENISITNEVTGYAHARGVLVEAEIGQVKGVEEDIVYNGSAAASYEDIDKFLDETNIDMIAVAFGNAHGVYEGEPKLHYDLVDYTTRRSEIPFVVHGGSGLSDGVIKKLLSINGVKKINISTEVKLAYRLGILRAYNNGLLEQKGFQAVNIENSIHNAITDMVELKLKFLSD